MTRTHSPATRHPTRLHLQDGDLIPGTGASELFFTTGDDEKLCGKGAFLLRTCEGAVDPDKVCPDARDGC